MAPPAPDHCEHCELRGDGLLCPAHDDLAGGVSGDVVVHLFRRGQTLFHAGEPAHTIHVVRTGRVRVFARWKNGDEQVLRLLGPGEILGYRPVLAGERYNASAEAVVDSEICILPAHRVRERLRHDPDLALRLLEKLAREMRQSEELLMELVHRPVSQRVARLLLSLVESGAATAPDFAICSHEMTRRDMARMVSTTPETISRVLRQLAERGAVSVARDCVRIRDLELLRRASGERPPEN